MTRYGLAGCTLIAVLLAPGAAPRAQQQAPGVGDVVLKPTAHP